jgi:hypothetical protein
MDIPGPGRPTALLEVYNLSQGQQSRGPTRTLLYSGDLWGNEPMESWSRWVSLLFRYGTWLRCSDKAPRTSARAERLRLIDEVSLSAEPVTPEAPGKYREQPPMATCLTTQARTVELVPGRPQVLGEAPMAWE